MKVTIPSIISGDLKEGKDKSLKFTTEEVEILFPEIEDVDLEKIKSSPKDIHELALDEIISFYSKVGVLWKDKEYPLRKDAIDLTSKVTSYSREMIEYAYDLSAEMLSENYLEHLVDAELRDKKFLDDWIKIKDVLFHAQPRGRVLHILAGNVPPIAVMSMIRGSLTKNANILKLPSGDPITSTYFALSFRDVDKEHPITRTTSVLYWEGDSKIGDELISLSNAICVWGGREAIESVRRKSGYNTKLLEFGPRRSVQLIGKEAFKNLKEVTDKVAHDLVLYDQEACHSPQFAFVEGNGEEFCKSLAKSLREEGERLPKGFVDINKHAEISHERLIAKFYGEKVFESEGTEWTLIISKDVKRALRHPLGRTLYLFTVKDLREALPHIDSSIQSVAVYPEKRIKEFRDELTLKGADRITHIGNMGYFAPGASHDGIFPLSDLVRWVEIDYKD
ncbi:MAG: acyl-CoA reductase [Methanocellales archaeon]|nr:acyl-CoA reductase [Methanocellales archaeon]MDD3291804.1 acyl-CoA reductase [Methanocellales archaeon]MDD5234582.1 acyl-CoA reductase [Methanocellales archaeon]MDD5485065.1 acyl-CoA reductase [Methanocellales archaeon]